MSTHTTVEGLPPLLPVSGIAQPRGVMLVDELSGKPATLFMSLHGVKFFYASPESAALDHASLSHVAHLVAARDVEERAEGSSSERAIHAARSRVLTERIARTMGELASERIAAGACELANPAALRYLRALKVLHGEDAIELLPAYLVLAEAALGAGHTAQAGEFLFTASYSVLRAEQLHSGAQAPVGALSLARLQRGYGRLYMAQRKLRKAVAAMAKAVYYASQCGGPEGLGTASSYYGLGCALLTLHEQQQVQTRQASAAAASFASDELEAVSDLDAVHACFDKVVHVFAAHAWGDLSPSPHELVQGQQQPREAASGDIAGAPTSPVGRFSPNEVLAAEEMLRGVAAIRTRHCGALHTSVADALAALAAVQVAAGSGNLK